MKVMSNSGLISGLEIMASPTNNVQSKMGFVQSFTLLKKNLIQSFRLDIIGIREKKREENYNQTKNFELSIP